MSDIVEEVARAIMEARGGCDVTDWAEAEWNPIVADALRDAQAAITTLLKRMEEPSEGMMEAGYATWDMWTSSQCDNRRELARSFSEPRWKAMLAKFREEEGL